MQRKHAIWLILVTVIAVVALGLAIAVNPNNDNEGRSALPGATTVHGCFNSAGLLEQRTQALSPQPCAHSTDRVLTWDVVPDLNPPATTTTQTTTTTRPAATTTTKSPSTTTAPPGTTTTIATTGIWKPTSAHSITWNWVIGGTPSPADSAQVMDVDGFETSAATVAAYHAKGTKVICYLDLGTYEPGRPDLNLIPSADIGAGVQGWPGEKWLNIADVNGLTPLIQSRVNICKSKGFDAVEPDDIDGYTNNTGFSLTATNQATYNEKIASVVHAAGMSVLLKNDVDQLATLQPFFDFALNEECNSFSECGGYSAFTNAGKAVFNAEYGGGTGFCAADAAKHINGGLFNLSLDGSGHTACPAW